MVIDEQDEVIASPARRRYNQCVKSEVTGDGPNLLCYGVAQVRIARLLDAKRLEFDNAQVKYLGSGKMYSVE